LTTTQIKERLDSIIDGQFVRDILKYELRSPREFVYCCDFQAFAALRDSILGRQLLVTDRDTWSTKDVILAYQSKTKIEYSFRTLKNPFHLALRPQFHWTDQKIEVHAFICVLAISCLLSYLEKQRNKHNIHTTSMRSSMICVLFDSPQIFYSRDVLYHSN